MFNKSLLLLVALISSYTIGFAQKQIKISTKWDHCKSEVQLFTFDGFSFRPIQKGKEKDDKIIFELDKGKHTFYYIGEQNKQLLPIILGEEDNVEIKGSCANASAAQIFNSPINQAYSELKTTMQSYVQRTGQLNTQLRRTNDEAEKQAILEKIKQLDTEKLALLDKYKTSNPILYRVVSLNTYVSFQYNNSKNHSNELDYFINEYFQFANLNDNAYNGLPWIYEGFKSYSGSVSGPRITGPQNKKVLETALNKLPLGSSAMKLAYGGVLATLEKNKHANYGYFAKKAIDIFGTADPALATMLQNKAKKMKGLMIGGEAPDFTGKTPDGMDLSLSDFRGKVVLVDFWASWCGPCRRENPHVVKLYNKYKDQGFDVLGVSLDKTKDRWLQAIEKDNLTWHHISDLKGWQSEFAKLYGVRSIPFTVLIDKEGNVIATRLRGKDLERKLEELFK